MPPAPVIKSHPKDIEMPTGHTVTLEVIALGALPLHYQWFFEFQKMLGMLKEIVCMFI